MVEAVNGKVCGVCWRSDKVLHLFIELEKRLHLSPGQFVMLTYKGTKRAYSVCNYGSTNLVELAIKLVDGGEMSEKLKGVETGDRVVIEGPFTEAKYEGNKILFLAGGIGVAAFISFLRALEKGDAKASEVWLFYSERYSEDLAFLGELKRARKFKVVITLTRERKEGYENRRLSRSMVEEYVGSLDGFSVYICGGRSFSLAMKEQFADLKPKMLAW